MKTYSISEARNHITRLPEELDGDQEDRLATVTRRGKPVLAIMTYGLYDAIMETLDVLGDPELMASLRSGIQDMKNGNSGSWEDVKSELGIDL